MFHNVSGELYSGFYPETVNAAILKSGKKYMQEVELMKKVLS
jgi:hypothetical protein